MRERESPGAFRRRGIFRTTTDDVRQAFRQGFIEAIQRLSYTGECRCISSKGCVAPNYKCCVNQCIHLRDCRRKIKAWSINEYSERVRCTNQPFKQR